MDRYIDIDIEIDILKACAENYKFKQINYDMISFIISSFREPLLLSRILLTTCQRF